MSSPEQPGNFEETKEHIPSEEEIASLFEQLLEGREFEELRKREDEKGLYFWEIKVPADDGGHIEYTYSRKGIYPETKAGDTVINAVIYDAEGMPYTGSSVARCIDGSWELTP